MVTARPHDRFVWDATAALESLGAAGVVLWMWEPERDSLRVTGPARGLGLGPLAPECSTAAILALAAPQDRALLGEFLQPQPPGEEIAVKVRMRGGPPCLWRGVWLEEGVRAAGAVVAESQFAPEPRDALTGLLERRAFLLQAAERLQIPLSYVLMVADLDRLRRLNEALGHERASSTGARPMSGVRMANSSSPIRASRASRGKAAIRREPSAARTRSARSCPRASFSRRRRSRSATIRM